MMNAELDTLNAKHEARIEVMYQHQREVEAKLEEAVRNIPEIDFDEVDATLRKAHEILGEEA